MDISDALKNMWSLSDKPERMRCFHKIVFEIGIIDPKQFWSEFWSIWTSSENLNEDIEYFPPLVEYGLALGSSTSALEEDEIAAFNSLPDLITVYRGCIDGNDGGWSWTTKQETAEWFAKRSCGSSDRLVMTAEVEKKHVLAYLLGRSEDEIVIDPKNLMDLDIYDSFEVQENARNLMFYQIQSGKFGDEASDKIRASMMCCNVSAPFDVITELTAGIDFMEWAGLKSKLTIFKEAKRLLELKRDDPETYATENPMDSLVQRTGFAL